MSGFLQCIYMMLMTISIAKVITGCSRGLGTEFVRQLADLGFNIVLIGRSKKVLDEIAAETG